MSAYRWRDLRLMATKTVVLGSIARPFRKERERTGHPATRLC